MRIFCPAMASLRSLSVGRQGASDRLDRRAGRRPASSALSLARRGRRSDSNLRDVVLVVVLFWCSFCTWDAAAPPTPEVGRVADPAQYRPDTFRATGLLSSACRARLRQSTATLNCN